MLKTNIIQLLIDKNSYGSYLEIRSGDSKNFDRIIVDDKISVDPVVEYNAMCQITSDNFFEQNISKFDIVLINEQHADQIYTDIQNSLSILNPGGVIICNGTNQQTEDIDVWKSFVRLRQEKSDKLTMFTVNTDEGCSIICRPGDAKISLLPEKFENKLTLTWENFSNNQNNWLNLYSVQEFLHFIDSASSSTKELIKLYTLHSEDPEINWKTALHYHEIGQFAPAVSFYVRCAERTDDVLLQYECMLRAAMCFQDQGIRKFSVKGMLQHAVCLLPQRPEAYHMLGVILSNENNDGNWFDSYTFSSLGLKVTKPLSELPKLRTTVNYKNLYELRIQHAHACFHTGLCAESKHLHIDLYNDENLPEYLKHLVKSNLAAMNGFVTEQIEYFRRSDVNELMHKFPGLDSIIKNQSESFQDMFVLSMHDGKKKGTYVEIGAGEAFYGNNTALLESNFEWTGVSLDINEDFVRTYSEQRKNICLLKDATTVNYEALFNALDLPTEIDYLQIDCDPPENSFKALLNIPFETRKFGVITFEHDHYANKETSIRDKSRKYLESYGYKLVVNNIAPDDWRAYEDWWIHPDLIDEKIVSKFLLINDDAKKARDYMLGLLK